MKIAVLLTGQLRTFDICKYIVKEAIINKYDTDIFLSIDTSNIFQDANVNSKESSSDEKIKNAIEYFNPCDTFICKLYDTIYDIEKLRLDKNSVESFQSIDKYQGIFEQYYVVKKAYELLINYSKKTGTAYDKIIRLRFDHLIWQDTFNMPTHLISSKKTIFNNTIVKDYIEHISKSINICFESPKDGEIYTAGWGNIGGFDYVNDHFWIHSHSLVDIMYIYYDNIPSILNSITTKKSLSGCPWYEIVFAEFLKQYNIKILKTRIIGLFCRELI